MGIRKMIDQTKETTGWSIIGLILGLSSSKDLLVQAIVIILFPIIAWTALHFWQRIILRRFPPKEPEPPPDEDDGGNLPP